MPTYEIQYNQELKQSSYELLYRIGNIWREPRNQINTNVQLESSAEDKGQRKYKQNIIALHSVHHHYAYAFQNAWAYNWMVFSADIQLLKIEMRYGNRRLQANENNCHGMMIGN